MAGPLAALAISSFVLFVTIFRGNSVHTLPDTIQRLSFTTPVYVWGPDRVERLEIGGYESLRGYSPGDISAVRAFLAGNTVLWLAAEDLSIQLGGSKRSVRIHSPRGLIALDAALTQSEPSVRNPVGFRLGAGPGFSVILSGGGLHFDLRGSLM